jgi:4-diphosphocytidyl-2-C-methyl-D-erythritol kinase
VSDRAVTRRAHAKVNVFLRVLGRRDDGFHEIETLVLPVSLHDVVTARWNPDSVGSVVMAIHAPSAEPIAKVDNLAVKASDLLGETAFPDAATRPVPLIEVEKWIPIAAGLGGGSADAAATLQVLNELWEAGFDDAGLAELGLRLGSDVPAMLAGTPVIAAGRGERLAPVHCPTTWWVLAPFGFPVRSADAYDGWDRDAETGPDPKALIAALETGDVELVGGAMFNDLEASVVAKHPEVGRTMKALRDAGALGSIVSGSGPTVVALAKDQAHAEWLASTVPGSMVVSAPAVDDGEAAG